MPYGIALLEIAVSDAPAASRGARISPPAAFEERQSAVELVLADRPPWGGVPLFLPAGRYEMAVPDLAATTPTGIELVDSRSGAVLLSLTDDTAHAVDLPVAGGMLLLRPTAGEAFVPGLRLRVTRQAPVTTPSP